MNRTVYTITFKDEPSSTDYTDGLTEHSPHNKTIRVLATNILDAIRSVKDQDKIYRINVAPKIDIEVD